VGIADPEIRTSEPFKEYLQEGQTFTLLGIRVVEGIQTQGYGEGDMAVLDVKLPNGEQKSLGLWGEYILAQARSAEDSDFPGLFQVVRDVVPEFSKRPVKMLRPVTDDASDNPL
jgi:hypothetical protein